MSWDRIGKFDSKDPDGKHLIPDWPFNISSSTLHSLSVYFFRFRWSWTNSTLVSSSVDPQILRVGNHAICRGWHQNQIVGGGTLKNGLCSAVFSDKIHFLKDFQVLTDISGTSKIEWQHWDMFTKRPIGIVAFKEKAFIAKVASKVIQIAIKFHLISN